MTELEFLTKNCFFTTRTYALFLGKAVAASSRKLKDRAKAGEIVQVTRGLWANRHHPDFTPYGAIPYLLDTELGYLSFLSALHRHDLISQIPTSIQIATTGRGRILKSPIGEFRFFQMKPEIMREGVNTFEGALTYNMASPEKALLDTFYLVTKKGKRFKRLPEIELNSFSEKKFLALLKSYPLNSQRPILERYRLITYKSIP